MKPGYLIFTVLLLCNPALAAPSETVSRQGQKLISTAHPDLVLSIDPAFRPLAPLAFPIEKATDAEREIFVDAQKGVVQRLVVVQFETVQKGSSFKFLYPSKPPATYGEQTYRFGTYVYDDVVSATASPGKESDLTRRYLEKQGFHMPRLLRTARLARVADPNGQSEVIVFYMENADADYPAGPLAGADEDGDLSLDAASAASLLSRLKQAVQPIKG